VIFLCNIAAALPGSMLVLGAYVALLELGAWMKRTFW
jgi:hypothetical protein